MTVSKEEMFANPIEYWDELTADHELFKEFTSRVGEIKKEQPKPWDILNPGVAKVDEAEAERRYAICLECPELLRITRQCKLCGCFMRVKTKLQDSYCPDGKW